MLPFRSLNFGTKSFFKKAKFEFYYSLSEYCLLIDQKVNKIKNFWKKMCSFKKKGGRIENQKFSKYNFVPNWGSDEHHNILWKKLLQLFCNPKIFFCFWIRKLVFFFVSENIFLDWCIKRWDNSYFFIFFLDGGPWIRSNKETLDVLGPARQSPKLFHQIYFWQKS